MSAISELSIRFREVLNYNKETGIFTWRIRTAQRCAIGEEAGYIAKDGYRRVTIDSVKYLAHRVAWVYVTGEWPKNQIDHVNGIRTDNRFSNLREATLQVNAENQRRPRKDNCSGFLGIYEYSPNRYRARIQVDGKSIHVGVFCSREAAHAAYVEAKRRLHSGCTI